MFKKGTQQSDDSGRRRPSPVEQNKIFSYRASRSMETEQRHRLRPKAIAVQDRNSRRSAWLSIRYIPTYLAIGAVVACLAYTSVLSDTPRVIISGKTDERVLLKDVSSYEAAIQTELERSVLNKSKLTFNAAAITESLTEQFPEVQTLRVTLPLIGKKPIIYIVPTQPKAILDTQNGSFVLDGRGKAITNATDQVPADTLRVRDDSGVAITVGDQALPLKNIRFIEEVQHQLADKGLKVSEIILPASSQSVLFRIEGKPYSIKFSFQSDAVQQAGAFLAAYDRFSKTNTIPNQYVDVRVGDKVYFQ